MDDMRLTEILNELRSLPKENEWVEFKEAKNQIDFNDLGEYFSALSNEANLNQKPAAWFVAGVEDGTRKIVGTTYRRSSGELDKLKHEIACKTNGRITFVNIHELLLPEGRIVLFEIPPAPRGIPTSWNGHFYGREGESLAALSLDKLERIRRQALPAQDWSAGIVAGATIADLDLQAVQLAREQYKIKNPRIANDTDRWDDSTFLDNARLTLKGAITHAAIVLLGKPQSSALLSPSLSQISWMLQDINGKALDYEHFNPPFISNVGKVFCKIRNLNYRYLKDGTLFPTEITQYDPWVIREALHNCIAHQDYTLSGRINIIEKPDQLIFSNSGSFIPGSIEAAISQNRPQEMYRNPFLAQAMVNLNMIDTVSSGIRKMFETQRQRFFPLPEYDLSDSRRVEVCIDGKIIDENYTRLLIEKTELDLPTVMLLDKVQKHIRLSHEQYRILKSQRLVEGRYPDIYVAAHIAAVSGDKAGYIKNRGFDDQYYQDMIVELVKKHGFATRKDIDNLLLKKLPEVLSEQKKRTKITNLLSKLRKEKIIFNSGADSKPKWVLYSIK